MAKIPTKLERAQLHALYAPAGALRDEADRQLEIETEKRLKQREQPRKHTEDELQIACCEYLKLHPRILYWSTPNHIFRGANTNNGAFLGYMAKQKRMGLRKGVSDLLMFFRNKDGQPTLACAELKAGYNQLSDDQQAFFDQANQRGAYTMKVKSLEDLQELLRIAGY